MFPQSTLCVFRDFSLRCLLSLRCESCVSAVVGRAPPDCIAPWCMQHMLEAKSDTPIETSAAWQESSRPAAPSSRCSFTLTYGSNVFPTSVWLRFLLTFYSKCLSVELYTSKKGERERKRAVCILA